MARATPKSDSTQCIADCLDCYKSCTETAMRHCLLEGGEHVEPSHFRLMVNCADLCRTTADFMLSGSEFQRRLCALCADVCDACADSCIAIGGMEDCVRACEQCAVSCSAMAADDKPAQRQPLLTHPHSQA